MRLWTTLLIYTRKSTSSGASQMRCNEVEILCTRLVFWVFVLSLLFFQWTDTKVIYSRFCMKARQWINPTFNTHISVSYRNSFYVFVFFCPHTACRGLRTVQFARKEQWLIDCTSSFPSTCCKLMQLSRENTMSKARLRKWCSVDRVSCSLQIIKYTFTRKYAPALRWEKKNKI
jgi:hypothetical protein